MALFGNFKHTQGRCDMYRNVEHALREIYKIAHVRIEPINNTLGTCNWVESKGTSGGSSGRELTQADWHANSAMIISRIERTLTPIELAVIESEYGANIFAVPIVSMYICEQNPDIDTALCTAILGNIWGRVKAVYIMDKFNLHKSTFYRRNDKIKEVVSDISTKAKLKLEDVFIEKGIISREWVA